MKDPLQWKATPYELLEIPVDAARGGIETAFKRAVTARKEINAVRSARNTLLNEKERLQIDALLYDDAGLQAAFPGRTVTPEFFTAKRQACAEALEAHRVAAPSSPAAVHVLAVFWFWWADYLETYHWCKEQGQPFPGAAAVDEKLSRFTFWRIALLYWAAVLSDEEYWRRWRSLRAYAAGAADDGALPRDLRSYLENTLQHYSERRRGGGDTEGAQKYQELLDLLREEAKGAALLRTLLTDPPLLPGGRLYLKKAGFLETVQEIVRRRQAENPDSDMWREAAALFSPQSGLHALLAARRYDELLRQIDALPEAQRQSEEFRGLRARACLEKGRQEFDLNRPEEAFALWRAALEFKPLYTEVRDTLVQASNTRASALLSADIDQGIRILQQALQLVNHKIMKQTLAQLFLQRGAKRAIRAMQEITGMIAAIQAGIQNSGTPGQDVMAFDNEAMSRFETARRDLYEGIEDIQTAQNHDPENATIRGELQAAQKHRFEIDLIDVSQMVRKRQYTAAVARLKVLRQQDPQNETVRQLQELVDSQFCFFCQKRPRRVPAPGEGITVDIYRVVQQVGTQIQYQSGSFTVPCCSECAKVHRRLDTVPHAMGLVGFILGTWLCIKIGKAGEGDVGSGFLSFLLFAVVFPLVGYLLSLSPYTRKKFQYKEYPPLARLLGQGWQFGKKPPNTV